MLLLCHIVVCFTGAEMSQHPSSDMKAIWPAKLHRVLILGFFGLALLALFRFGFRGIK